MRDKLRDTFNQIQADEALKEKTKNFVFQRIKANPPKATFAQRRLIPAVACFLVLLFSCWGGYYLYFTPTSVISIDVNPSVELGINRFDKVVTVEGYNVDGEILANELQVKYLDYSEALQQILSSDTVSACLAQNESVSIVVVGEEEERVGLMLSHVTACAEGHENVYCDSADWATVSEAHEAGLSYGKYKAFLEVLAVCPNITTEEIAAMTMKEIHTLIEFCTPTQQDTGITGEDTSSTNGHHGEYGHGGAGNDIEGTGNCYGGQNNNGNNT